MCIKSSCTQCHSKSHCQEKELRDQIEKLESILKDSENYDKLETLSLRVNSLEKKLEKMKNCDNCKHVDYEYDGNTCELWDREKIACSRYFTSTKGLSDLWELK